jgi:hypothetical protein
MSIEIKPTERPIRVGVIHPKDDKEVSLWVVQRGEFPLKAAWEVSRNKAGQGLAQNRRVNVGGKRIKRIIRFAVTRHAAKEAVEPTRKEGLEKGKACGIVLRVVRS